MCKQNLVEPKTCIQSFIIYFWDFLYSAVGNCSLLHASRSKIGTAAEILLKKSDSRQQERTNFCMFYMFFL